MMVSFLQVLSISVLAALLPMATGHGYIKDPPSRPSLWREFEGDTLPDGVEINYEDNELFCGGFSVSTRLIALVLGLLL